MKVKITDVLIVPIAFVLFLIPLFWNPSFIYSFTQGKEILFKFAVLFSVLFFSFALILKKNLQLRDIFSSKLFVLLLLQFLVFAITNLLSTTSTVALYGTYSRGFGFVIELFLFIFLIYSATNLSEKVVIKLLKIFLISSILVAIYAVMQKFGINPFFETYSIDIFNGRVFSFLGNPSYLGQFMLLNILLSGYLFSIAKNIKTQTFYFIVAFLFFIVLLVSGTRTALFGLMISILILSIKYFKVLLQIIKKHKFLYIVSILTSVFLFFILANDRFAFSNIAFRSLDSRFEIWKGALSLIKKKFFLGYGGETFYIYFPEIITKKFLSLEENINITADKLHNESLEILFSHGLLGLTIYILVILYILKLFFKSKNKLVVALSLLIIANTIQNQLSFPDITINVLVAFCYAALISMESFDFINIKLNRINAYIYFLITICIITYISYFTIYQPYMSQLAYAESKANYSISYETSVSKHKEAIYYSPHYSELWYELMIMDSSSMERALFNLEIIEGMSGNVLAWKGNFYAKDPEKAADFYIKALKKNPYHPNWIRAFADMLYANGDLQNALYLYNQYLEAVPDFWKWTGDLENRNLIEQNSYRIFFKNTPDFWKVVDRINDILYPSNNNPQERAST